MQFSSWERGWAGWANIVLQGLHYVINFLQRIIELNQKCFH